MDKACGETLDETVIMVSQDGARCRRVCRSGQISGGPFWPAVRSWL